MKKALLIIDMQKRWINPAHKIFPSSYVALIAINQLRRKFKSHKFPVFHIILEHEPDGSSLHPRDSKLWNARGSEEAKIVEELRPSDDEVIISKNRYSAFFGTNLHNQLKNLGVTNVTITGYQMRACVIATSLDAYQYGYETEVVEDAVLDTDEEYSQMYLKIFRDAGFLVSSDNILAKL